MPRPRFQRAPIEKRDAVLDAAAQEFGAHGYDNASVNRILLAAGFSKGSFYYYFDDKADLATAVLEREAARYLAVWSEVGRPNSADEFWSEVEKLMNLGATRMHKAGGTTTDALMRLGTAIARHPELLERMSGSVVSQATARVAAFWTRGQEIGAVRHDLPIGTLVGLLQDVKIALVRALLPHDRAPTSDEIEAFLRVHLDLIRRISEVREPEP